MIKSHTRFYNKVAFTIVELAVVLVIIGLLIGGILVAQSMQTTTKIQAFIRQISQIDAAVSNFKTTYAGLPGDTTSMGCTSNGAGGNVCDNGVIEGATGISGSTITINLQQEVVNFWPNLQTAGFNGQGVTFINTHSVDVDLSPPTQHSPRALVGTKAYILPYYYRTTSTDYAMFYLIASPNGTAQNTFASPYPYKTVPATDMLSVDLKLDDGLPNNPNSLLASGCNALQCKVTYEVYVASGAYNGAAPACVSGGAYNVGTAGATCSMLIKMFSTNGDK